MCSHRGTCEGASYADISDSATCCTHSTGQGSQVRNAATSSCDAAKAAWGPNHTCHQGERCTEVQSTGTRGQATVTCATGHTDTAEDFSH